MPNSIPSASDEYRYTSREKAYATPLSDFDVGNPELFRSNTFWPYFERLRREDPVHYCRNSMFGPYWSVTKYNDIVEVETRHDIYSSEASLGGFTIRDAAVEFRRPNFMAMDPPKHSAQRKAVAPMFTPTQLDNMVHSVRQRTTECLDALPRNQTFDWVDRVSIELTTQMLAVLFDFPWDERLKLAHWSDVATTMPIDQAAEDRRQAELEECGAYFAGLWNERINAPRKGDMLSMMSHDDATRDMDPKTLLGNVILLIVAGNDTTRNTMTGSVLALSEHPDQRRMLRDNHALIDSFVPEVIRWQTPIAHMRRTALRDVELGGKQIKKGDKVVMWYVSGNYDESVIENPESFVIDRARPRQHLSFGYGIHRCVGLRLAELQLKIVWQEMLKRFDTIEVVDQPKRVYSSFVKGYETLPVRIAG
jgi:cytochrome P450